jgi:hypothetical protein
MSPGREKVGKKRGLTKRQKGFAEAKARGLNNAEAARVAGYSETVAQNAQDKILAKPGVQAYFCELLEHAAPPKKLIRILSDRLEGKVVTTKIRRVVNAKGKLIETIHERTETIDGSVSLRALELCVHWAGYVQPSSSPDGDTSTNHFNFNFFTVEAATERIAELTKRIRERARDAKGKA